MEYESDFYSDYIVWLKSQLTAKGITFDPNADLLRIETTYWTPVRRSVSVRPRRILKAKEFTVPAHLKAPLEALENKFRKGEDVNAHLSNTRFNATKKSFNDGLHNDWDIQHFHFDPVKRRDECLFAIVKDDDIYFLDILPHGKYAEPELRERLKSNGWDHLLGHRMYLTSYGPGPTEEEVMKARANGITPLVPLADGSVHLSPGGGISTAGVGNDSVNRADRARDRVRQFQDCFATEGIDWVEAQGIVFSAKPTFKLVGDADGHFDVVDTEGKVRFPLGSIHPRVNPPSAAIALRGVYLQARAKRQELKVNRKRERQERKRHRRK